MATGPTGFKFNYNGIKDFFDVFQPGNAAINTGFKINNSTDLGNLFSSGNSGITTNYKNPSGNDLGSLFLPKLPFSTTGATTLVTTSTTDPNYCYAIFTSAGTVTTEKNSGTLYSICVGGGGAGGWSQVGISPGGGGGGGVEIKEIPLSSYSIGTIFTVSVGAGGQAIYGSVRSGVESSLKNGTTFISRVSGGIGGNDNGSGSGGGYYDPPTSATPTVLNGGGGGDRTDGYNSSSYSASLNIPPALDPYIASSYCGGGGGGKGNSDSTPFYGGGGGNNGLGGKRPSSTPNYTNYNGESGLSYGAGGGAAGFKSIVEFVYIGGNGANGVVIVYSPL